MSDIDDFDLDRSTAQAWTAFSGRLSEVLSMMDEEAELRLGTLSADGDRSPYLAYACPTLGEIVAQASANADLDPEYRLSTPQTETLVRMGWTEPADGGDFSATWSQEDTDGLADLSVTTLRDIFGVQHPVFLEPSDLAEVLAPPAPKEWGDTSLAGLPFEPHDVVAVLARDAAELDAMVEQELSHMYGHLPVRDSGGDFAIRVGSTMVFVRVTPDAREVIVFSAVVHDITGRSRAAEILNDLNAESRWVRFALHRDRVFGSISVFAQPFVPAHLHLAVRELAEVADGIDESLAETLRGRTTFSPGA